MTRKGEHEVRPYNIKNMEHSMDIRGPEVGESIVEALVAKWRQKDGDAVRREEPVCELETDKVTLELNAEADGILSILVPEGSTVAIGAVIGSIREALKAGWRLAMTETTMTVAEIMRTSAGETPTWRMSPCCWPKL